MKHFETAMVAPEDNENGVINVPADCMTVEEAIKAATAGQTILFAEGEHAWKGKIEVEKALHFRGLRDKVTGFPASKLRGRWRIRIPPPNPWDRNPQELCTFTDVWCESDSGYCMEITQGHVQMHNVRCFCNGGTSLSVSNTEVGVSCAGLLVQARPRLRPDGQVPADQLHGCILGFPRPGASYGIVVGEKGLVWMQQTVMRYW